MVEVGEEASGGRQGSAAGEGDSCRGERRAARAGRCWGGRGGRQGVAAGEGGRCERREASSPSRAGWVCRCSRWGRKGGRQDAAAGERSGGRGLESARDRSCWRVTPESVRQGTEFAAEMGCAHARVQA